MKGKQMHSEVICTCVSYYLTLLDYHLTKSLL